jgi:hypothetical protein
MPLPPQGITPPTPGLEHEEPEMMVDEDDIPESSDAEDEASSG